MQLIGLSLVAIATKIKMASNEKLLKKKIGMSLLLSRFFSHNAVVLLEQRFFRLFCRFFCEEPK